MSKLSKDVFRILVIITCALIVSLAGNKAQTDEVKKVGIIGKGSQKAFATRLESIKQGMKEYGYVEGQNVSFEYRFADGNLDILPTLANELQNLDLDLLVAAGCPAADAAKELANTVPVVVYTTNPVTTGLVKTFAH
ncbi:MAG: hypothetical protein HKP41_03165, partial [Desulfobacterales bacterium]|nr:hypothetical protein [Desulfobacterales bacterium]